MVFQSAVVGYVLLLLTGMGSGDRLRARLGGTPAASFWGAGSLLAHVLGPAIWVSLVNRETAGRGSGLARPASTAQVTA